MEPSRRCVTDLTMKHRLLLLVLAALCAVASASGQTIRSLGYNTTNGEIVAATNVVWTNAFTFSTNTVAAQVRTNLGLGSTNAVSFGSLSIADTNNAALNINPTNAVFTSRVQINNTNGIVFGGVNSNTAAAVTRTNLSLGLPAFTNTSNVTLMRALAGSTNTNQPYSGTITIEFDGNAPIAVVVSNGIILEVGTY
jgi:hypothetical protein